MCDVPRFLFSFFLFLLERKKGVSAQKKGGKREYGVWCCWLYSRLCGIKTCPSGRPVVIIKMLCSVVSKKQAGGGGGGLGGGAG